MRASPHKPHATSHGSSKPTPCTPHHHANPPSLFSQNEKKLRKERRWGRGGQFKTRTSQQQSGTQPQPKLRSPQTTQPSLGATQQPQSCEGSSSECLLTLPASSGRREDEDTMKNKAHTGWPPWNQHKLGQEGKGLGISQGASRFTALTSSRSKTASPTLGEGGSARKKRAWNQKALTAKVEMECGKGKLKQHSGLLLKRHHRGQIGSVV